MLLRVTGFKGDRPQLSVVGCGARREREQGGEKDPAARRRPKAAREAYFLYVERAAEGERLEAAVARVYRDGKVLTPDQGGTANTREMAQAVLAAYRNA